MSNLALLNSIAYLLSQQQQQQQQGTTTKKPRKVQYSTATCPDQECRTKLYFPSHEASVECPNCGQRHTVQDLPDKQELTDKERGGVGLELAQVKQLYSAGKRTPELVKVKGISNYHCKLLSPLLTHYGMDKSDQPKLLKELGLGEMFDCSKLGGRAFAIEEAQLSVAGYGRDKSGSQKYLHATLGMIKDANNNTECLVPVHADGDGHCLVHAISRCLVGRELFWHALRSNLHHHLTSNLDRYKEIFKEFYSEEEWSDIIDEAGPDFQPPDGQSLGLRNIHVFGLANVLRRPIVLLDSVEGMQSCGDYSGIFLPAMYLPEECQSKDSSGAMKPNSPIIIAWSSYGRNHYIPLVPIKGKPLPKLPHHLQPKVWGQEEDILSRYVSRDSNGCVEVCGGKELADRYLLKLVGCMEKVFKDKHGVSPSLVADVDQFVYKGAGFVGVSSKVITDATRCAIEESRLFRCLICSAISCVPPEWLINGGMLYEKAKKAMDLEDGLQLKFPFDGVLATYDATSDSLVPFEVSCFWCTSTTRLVNKEGNIVYHNGDRTSTPADGSRCGCGYKHYWDGKEYDNLPMKVPISLTWANRTKQIEVYWFQYESDPSANSNVYEVAQKAINDHFPGEFGSERLVQQVVDLILKSTEQQENMEQVTGQHPTNESKVKGQSAASAPGSGQQNDMNKELPEPYSLPASKMIITGQKTKTLHKEELTASNTERKIKRRIEENATKQQQKRKAQLSPTHGLTGATGGGRKADSTPTRSQGARVSPSPPSSTQTTPSDHTPSPTSKPAKKKIKVTSSDGKMANLTLDPSITYSQLKEAIARELSIPAEQQRLRAGFPPKELKPSDDPSHPVELVNGERVSVDIVNTGPVGGAIGSETTPTTSMSETPSTRRGAEQAGGDNDDTALRQANLSSIIQQMMGDIDLWTIAQHQPQMFHKGGEYYKQVVDQFGSRLSNNTHLQFKEFPNKTFSFNAQKECLEVCLGLQHIPVGPLSPEQEQLAHAASVVSSQPKETENQHGAAGSDSHNSHLSERAMGMSGALNRPLGPQIKAFSGQGRTLSSSSSGGGGMSIAGSVSSTGMPYAGGRSEASRTEEDPLLQTAQLVVQKKLTLLQSKEKELQLKVRAFNRQLVEAESNEDGASVRDDRLTSLETKLLDTSSELKKVREEIKELTTFQ